MDDQTISNLKEALRFSPDNLPLRNHLAETLLNAGRLEEAEKEYTALISLSNDRKYRAGLAKTFSRMGHYAKAIVIAEELIDSGNADFEVHLLYTRALFRENSLQQAAEAYKEVIALNPSFRDEELDRELRVSAGATQKEDLFDDDGDEPARAGSYFIHKPDINFGDVGGMDAVKKEIDLKIIKPLLHPGLYKAYGKKTGGGILLYGPPGCGKTYLAKATAGQVNASFISVGLNDILDMWIGNSEKNLHRIFEVARQNTPCVLFFDEIDALGASRSDMKQSAGRHLINQFLQELDGIESSNEGILVLGATNTPWHLDQAFRRPGRFDRILFIPPPDEGARESIYKIKLKSKPSANIDYTRLARKTEGFSGADIEASIDVAVEEKLNEAFVSGIPGPLDTAGLLQAVKKIRPSTLEWFTTAKNFALFANESGLYNDILSYLKISR